MFIVISYITILGLIGLCLNTSLNKKLFVIITGVSLFLIAALRTIHFGPDVLGYVTRYYSLSSVNISVFWTNFINSTGKDPLFYFFSKIISLMGASHQVWLAIIAAIFIFSVSKIIYRYSEEPYISFISLISLGYFFFSLTGLRQALALSIILLSYKYLRDRKLLSFIFIVLFASLFHSSALIFIIAYPIANMKVGFKHFLGILGALVVSLFFNDQLRYFVGKIGWNDELSGYAKQEITLNFSGFFIQLFIYLFCLYYKKRVIKTDSNNLSLYNLLLLGLIFQAFSTVIAEFFRVSMYFSLFCIVLIPNALNVIKDKNIKIIVYFSVVSVLFAYILWTGTYNGFKFFWQEV